MIRTAVFHLNKSLFYMRWNIQHWWHIYVLTVKPQKNVTFRHWINEGILPTEHSSIPSLNCKTWEKISIKCIALARRKNPRAGRMLSKLLCFHIFLLMTSYNTKKKKHEMFFFNSAMKDWKKAFLLLNLQSFSEPTFKMDYLQSSVFVF